MLGIDCDNTSRVGMKYNPTFSKMKIFLRVKNQLKLKYLLTFSTKLPKANSHKKYKFISLPIFKK